MRLGADILDIRTPEEWAQRHVELGYGAAFWPSDAAPYDADERMIQAYLTALQRRGLIIAEVGAWCNLLDANPETREKNLNYVIGQLKLADRVGARCCVNIAGSLNVQSWCGPHPDNLSDANFRRIVELIQQIIDSAAPKHTCFSLESMPWLFPYDIESTERILKAVNRAAFGVHVDMCNLINGYEKVYRSGELVRSFFSEFGDKICSVHAKDIALVGELTVQIQEVVAGEGVFDHDALLKACDALDNDLPVMLEHLHTPDEYLRAATFMQTRARKLGLRFVEGHAPR